MASIDRLSHVCKSEYLDPNLKPTGFQLGDWVRVEFDFAGHQGKSLYGEVSRVGERFPSGVYNIDILTPVMGPKTITVPAEYCAFLGFPVTVGEAVDEFINQGLRNCEVTEVKHTRLRLEWDMSEKMMTKADKRRQSGPGVQGGWRTGVRIGERLFYPCGEQRVAPKGPIYTGAALDAFVRSRTAFESLEDMVTAAGGYRPTIRVDAEPGFLQLADAYDQAQIKRGDERRAYRG